MLCGCNKKARLEKHNEPIDSPLQMRLIKMFGLQPYFLQNFVFRRKASTYSIRNIKGVNTIFYGKLAYKSPSFYSTQVQILEIGHHSIPLIKLSPVGINNDENLPCIVYAHGNSSDLGDSLRFITNLTNKFRAEYVAFDFTGYGQSRKSNCGEEIICKDLEIVLAWLNKPVNSIILWGFSLGTFPVVVNAAKYNIKAVILQCPIGSLACMFYEEYESNIKFKEDHFANIEHIAKVQGRVLMMHSMADEVIPIGQAKLLLQKYTSVNGIRQIIFIEVEKLLHNNLHKYITSAKINDLQMEVISFLQTNQREMQRIQASKNHVDLCLIELSQGIHILKVQQDYLREDIIGSTQAQTNLNVESWFCFQR